MLSEKDYDGVFFFLMILTFLLFDALLISLHVLVHYKATLQVQVDMTVMILTEKRTKNTL